MSTKATLVVQDLTYTEKFLKGVTITYSNGGTAGSEVVTVSGLTITVQIGASTATQVKAAIDGNEFSSALVSVAISGTAGTVQKTCKGAFLTGGLAAAKSTLIIGGVLKLTSVANGGTAVRFKFTAGATAGSEVVTVSTNDITCQIADGVSTYAQIKTAYDAVGAAIALATTSSAGTALSQVASVAQMSAFTNLAGGTAAVAATVVNQDLTVTAAAAGVAGNLINLSYTTGATAGSEVVTVVGNAINVQISNGVSTATQINAAFGAAGAATALGTMTVSGTGATAQKTVNVLPTAGAVGDGAPDYYQDGAKTALTASYVAFPFGFMSNNMTLVNDETSGAKGVIFSFDGITQHGSLLFGQSITWQAPNQSCIWMKFVSAAPAYRLMVQGK